MFGNHGLCGLPEEGAPKCLGGNLGDFGGFWGILGDFGGFWEILGNFAKVSICTVFGSPPCPDLNLIHYICPCVCDKFGTVFDMILTNREGQCFGM
ncbi:TPA: hypothetical protein WJG25_002016 [Neisseria meningitidis]